jgi:hypothetical protein
MILIIGFSMFIVFQTIPILVENPKPVGFGGDPISAANVQLPFALVFLVFGPVSCLLISKLGSIKPIMVGTAVGAIGFFVIMISHSTEMSLSLNLAITSVGLTLTNVGAQNVIIFICSKREQRCFTWYDKLHKDCRKFYSSSAFRNVFARISVYNKY